jgi:hypothetical protein
MISGKFFLTADLVKSKRYIQIDHRDKEYSFIVISKGEDEGIFGMSCKWNLTQIK